jgi:hypothetical protein
LILLILTNAFRDKIGASHLHLCHKNKMISFNRFNIWKPLWTLLFKFLNFSWYILMGVCGTSLKSINLLTNTRNWPTFTEIISFFMLTYTARRNKSTIKATKLKNSFLRLAKFSIKSNHHTISFYIIFLFYYIYNNIRIE